MLHFLLTFQLFTTALLHFAQINVPGNIAYNRNAKLQSVNSIVETTKLSVRQQLLLDIENAEILLQELWFPMKNKDLYCPTADRYFATFIISSIFLFQMASILSLQEIKHAVPPLHILLVNECKRGWFVSTLFSHWRMLQRASVAYKFSYSRAHCSVRWPKATKAFLQVCLQFCILWMTYSLFAFSQWVACHLIFLRNGLRALGICVVPPVQHMVYEGSGDTCVKSGFLKGKDTFVTKIGAM